VTLDSDLLTIKTGIAGKEQEGSFMNATLQTVEGLAGPIAVSVAVHLPDHANDQDEDEIAAMLRTDFKHLTDIGYSVEIQIGPDE
jgi:hypothetical protein